MVSDGRSFADDCSSETRTAAGASVAHGFDVLVKKRGTKLVREKPRSKKEREGAKGEGQERCAVAGAATYLRRAAEQNGGLAAL